MNIAYKYLVLGGDPLFVFSVVEDIGVDDIHIGVTSSEEVQFLKIGQSMYVPLDDEIVGVLKRAKSIIMAESSDFEFRIEFRGELEMDPVLIGQIIAYYEIGKEKLRSEREKQPLEIAPSQETVLHQSIEATP